MISAQIVRSKRQPGGFVDFSKNSASGCFYSAAALHAMQSAVIPKSIPSVRPSVRPSVTRWYPIQTNERPRSFQQAIDEVRMLPLSPPKGGSNSKLVIFVKKNQFKSNKLCYKVSVITTDF